MCFMLMMLLMEGFSYWNQITIYMEDKMDHSLSNPIQAEEEDVRVDIWPKRYSTDPYVQTITFSDVK